MPVAMGMSRHRNTEDEFRVKAADLPVPQLDFTAISRWPNKISTWISIDDYVYRGAQHVWIKCGAISLSPPRDSGRAGVWRLDARGQDGWTDFEHDSIKIVALNLIGVSMCFLDNGLSVWNGWISPEVDSFRVPTGQDYIDKAVAEAKNCTHCKGKNKHKMLGEGFYVPKANEEMFEKVARYPIEIRTWTVFPKEEQE